MVKTDTDKIHRSMLSHESLLILYNNEHTKQKKVFLKDLVTELLTKGLIDDNRVKFLSNRIKKFNDSNFYIPRVYGVFLRAEKDKTPFLYKFDHESFKKADLYITTPAIIAKERNPFLLDMLFNKNPYEIKKLDYPESLISYIDRKLPSNSKYLSNLKELDTCRQYRYLSQFSSILFPSLWE
jgi:hypothetical protein